MAAATTSLTHCSKSVSLTGRDGVSCGAGLALEGAHRAAPSSGQADYGVENFEMTALPQQSCDRIVISKLLAKNVHKDKKILLALKIK